MRLVPVVGDSTRSPCWSKCKHSLFVAQIGVYASLGIGRGLNKHSYGIAIKIVGALLTILVFWDIR